MISFVEEFAHIDELFEETIAVKGVFDFWMVADGLEQVEKCGAG